MKIWKRWKILEIFPLPSWTNSLNGNVRWKLCHLWVNHQFLFNDWKRFFFSQTYFIRFPTYQSQVLGWLCNKYCCYVTAHDMQHVGSRDSNVQSPALFFAVKSSIIMESYHNVTIYSAGKCTLLLKILKTAFFSQRFAVHREKRMNLFLFTRRWINSKSQQYCRCHPRACA